MEESEKKKKKPGIEREESVSFFSRESLPRIFCATLSLDGGAVKCDMGQAGRKRVRKEGNEPATTDRKSEMERERGRERGRALSRAKGLG